MALKLRKILKKLKKLKEVILKELKLEDDVEKDVRRI
jgi:hypothetical protein